MFVTQEDCPPDFGPNAGHNRHRAYYVTTSDFVHFGPPTLLFDPGSRATTSRPLPQHSGSIDHGQHTLHRGGTCSHHDAGVNAGESVIDAFLFRANGRTYAVYKSEQNICAPFAWHPGGELRASEGCTLALRLATASSAIGPFEVARVGRTPIWEDTISRQCAEGPTVLQLERRTLVLYDGYRGDCSLLTKATEPCPAFPGNVLDAASPTCSYKGSFGYGAIATEDLVDWSDVSQEIRIPRGHKHGTALRLTLAALCSICSSALNRTVARQAWAGTAVIRGCEERAWCLPLAKGTRGQIAVWGESARSARVSVGE